MPVQHRELHVDVDQVARQRVVDHLAVLHQLAVPQVPQLLGKRVVHFVAKHHAQLAQQGALGLGTEHLQGLLVHVHHPDFFHAPVYELGVHLDESGEILDALLAHLVQQPLDCAEVLHPE